MPWVRVRSLGKRLDFFELTSWWFLSSINSTSLPFSLLKKKWQTISLSGWSGSNDFHVRLAATPTLEVRFETRWRRSRQALGLGGWAPRTCFSGHLITRWLISAIWKGNNRIDHPGKKTNETGWSSKKIGALGLPVAVGNRGSPFHKKIAGILTPQSTNLPLAEECHSIKKVRRGFCWRGKRRLQTVFARLKCRMFCPKFWNTTRPKKTEFCQQQMASSIWKVTSSLLASTRFSQILTWWNGRKFRVKIRAPFQQNHLRVARRKKVKAKTKVVGLCCEEF